LRPISAIGEPVLYLDGRKPASIRRSADMERAAHFLDQTILQTAPIPSDETQRKRALTIMNILDTLPGERFDRITRPACRAFDVPIALVNLVDHNDRH
jgi:hypothetical protein